MNFYPYVNPIILTDDIYDSYGGDITVGMKSQRAAAYWLAEEKVSESIETFLLPTIVTGTYHFKSYKFLLENSYVNRIIETRLIDFQERTYYTVTGTSNIYVGLEDDVYGIVDLSYVARNCHCHTSSRPSPHKVQIVYEAGLSSGTSFRPNVLLALTEYAKIALNEIIGMGNEAPGDIGVKEYRNQQYAEVRKGLINTDFGSSAKANFIHRTLSSLRNYRHVGI